MAAANTDLLRKKKSNFSTTLASGISDSDQTIPLSSGSGLPTDTAITLTIDRVDADNVATPAKRERVTGVVSTNNLINCLRGEDDTTAQVHSSGAIVEDIWDAETWNDMIDWGLVEHNQDGTHKETALDSMIAGSEAAGDIIYHNGSVWARLAKGSDGQSLVLASGLPSWAYPAGLAIASQAAGDLLYYNGSAWIRLAIGASGKYLKSTGSAPSWDDAAAFWAAVPGTPTRVSDTQFTIADASNANKYDLLFKKGVILKWDESGTTNVAMVISSSYSSDVVTINVVGDSLTAGFGSMKYCIQMAQCLDFILPGALATGTSLSRVHHAPTDLIKLSVDAYVKTAGTTNATTFDVNDDGSTIITTKPSIASGATSDIDNVCDAPTTVIAQDSVISIDIDAVSTTAPVEGYIKLWVFPSSWLYRI